jgi:hypothetical protein
MKPEYAEGSAVAEKFEDGGWPTLSLISILRVPRPCRVFRDRTGILTS